MTSFLRVAAQSAVLAAAFGASQGASAKQIGKLMPPDQSFELLLDTLPEGGKDNGIELNKTVTITVKINPLTEAGKKLKFSEFKFDARMPAHKHGMVTKPKITETSPTDIKIEGVKLHMAGEWEFYLGLKAGDLPVFWTMPQTLK